ncbi:MAG: branched-chain amino acid ABC transporter permease [Xanthobacteraceae bacterium]
MTTKSIAVPYRANVASDVRTLSILAIAVAAAALACAPFVLNDYQVNLVIEAMVFGIFAIGLNFLVGYTGLVSLGHAMFLGIGGYGFGIFTVLLDWPWWAAIPATILCSAVLSFLIGIVCIRSSGVGFFIMTLAFSELMYGLAFKTKLVGGDDGMSGISRPDIGFLGLDIYNPATLYGFMLVAFAIVLFVSWRIIRSPFGMVLVGIRENESRMRALGYRTQWYKMAVFTLSGMISSFGGVMLVIKTGFMSPETLSWMMSGEGLLMVIVGGAGTFLGPVLGAAAYVLLRAGLTGITDHWILFLGSFFVLTVVFFRGGLIGLISGAMAWVRR